jgi:NAD/NADP transhydrogenase beta subunit
VAIKRSLAAGFAGIGNPHFHKEGMAMPSADAKQAFHDVTATLAAV